MASIHALISALNGYLWGPPMLVLLFGTHVFLTIRLGFIQRHIGHALRLSFARDNEGKGDISHFGALVTALAATIGTGNIVGVSTAVALGGPGAVLWMWLTGVFGISTKYAEALLSVKYRTQTSDGTMLGGPMFVLDKALGMKWLGVLFAVFTAIAAFGIGNTVQANSIAQLALDRFHIAPHITGLILTVTTGIVILGGVRWVARVCAGIVPFMAIFYVLGCLFILIVNRTLIGPAVMLIVRDAFTARAAGGGFIGATVLMALRFGIARGLFSNESGLGSAPIVAAAARTTSPVRQALVSATGTFWDTVVICAMTGLVIVTSIIKNPVALSGLKGPDLTRAAFEQIPVVGPTILVVGLLTFVFSTILGWSYYGERAVEYLLGKKAIRSYRILWTAAVFVGATAAMPLVWDFADAMNAMMAIPNLISLLLLSGTVAAETATYLGSRALGKRKEALS